LHHSHIKDLKFSYDPKQVVVKGSAVSSHQTVCLHQQGNTS